MNPTSAMACINSGDKSKSWKRVLPSTGSTANSLISQGAAGTGGLATLVWRGGRGLAGLSLGFSALEPSAPGFSERGNLSVAGGETPACLAPACLAPRPLLPRFLLRGCLSSRLPPPLPWSAVFCVFPGALAASDGESPDPMSFLKNFPINLVTR
ncbi:LPXTG-motif cell wall anchor domain protein [Cellvibrio japonicus Ueda107]|uniref:LPXTG-motif cell wall anchor domain protein n=1 Tax=Cellvibrio japonicus (strain Ueda107) TaxID=498211 RepID=B3PLE4_CELJU|nr:LPXTG-motif cell wall anchor domain protein [Cellvibrio japonicus Ueda107]